MKGSYVVAALVALVAFAHALPVAEESWSDSDELLARVFSDPTPVSLMQKEADLNEEGHQASIDESSTKAEDNHAKAEKAEAKEEKWTKKEAKRTKRAAKLAKKQARLTAKADNAKANAEAAAYMADVVGKAEAAAKASADADAANDEAQAKYAATQKEIAASGKAADAATEKRLAEEKAAAEATAAALETANSDLETAHADLAKAKKNNGLNAKAAEEEIAQEAEDNKAAAKKEHDEIEDKYAKKEAVQDAAKASWQAKADDDAKALAATRAATQAKFEAKAAADQADYEKKMAHAAELQADADKAQGAYEDDVAAGEHEQDEADAMTKAELGYGNEIEECATGTQCLDATDMKCKDLGTTFCIAKDQFSCAPVPASGECAEFGAAPGAGLATYNVAPALTVAPIPAPTKACIDHIKGAGEAIPGGILSEIMHWDPEHEDLPMVKFFCGHDDLSGATVKSAFEYFMKALEICPMYCVPGSAETVKSTDGKEDLPINHGTCLTNADAAQFGQEVEDLPIYKAQGTNDRFDAANNLNEKICSRAKMFEEGWKGGQDTSLIQKEADLNEEGHQASIDESSTKAEDNHAKAEEEKAKEEKWTKKEAKRTKRAAKLAKKQARLTAKAEADNAKANAEAAAYMAEVVGKAEAAAKASADADAANDEAQAKYAATQKEIAASGKVLTLPPRRGSPR